MVDPAAPPPELWELTDHVCRVCFGRIVMGRMPDGYDGDRHHRRWRCSNCGAETAHRLVTSVCACGIRLRSGRDPGIRCERNLEQTPEFPSEIVAGQTVESPAK